MTLNELIQRLQNLAATGHGELRAEVRNAAGDFADVDAKDGIRVSGDVVVIEG